MREKSIKSRFRETEVNPDDKRYQKAMADTYTAHQQFVRGEITCDECTRRYEEIFHEYSSGVLADMRKKAERLSRE